MADPNSRRPFTFAVPMLIGIIAAQQALAHHVRAVDVLLLFAGGAAFGIGIAELIRFIKSRRAS